MMDISEQRARNKGERKNWSEEKIQRRADMRRAVRIFFTRTLPEASVAVVTTVAKGVVQNLTRSKGKQ